jgi:ribose/xylose/arabinose/galactoside ABC-type transport system permease subunit
MQAKPMGSVCLGNRNFLSAYNLNTIVSYSAILLVVGLGQMCPILIGGIDLSVGVLCPSFRSCSSLY